VVAVTVAVRLTKDMPIHEALISSVIICIIVGLLTGSIMALIKKKK
jgi:hypothetical protein